MRALGGTVALLALAVAALAAEPVPTDLEALNTSIGYDYESAVSAEALVDAALAHRLVLYGEVHDQADTVRHFLDLVESVRARSSMRLCIGIEFVDRGDWDLLNRYLARKTSESAFLARVMPTSLLLVPKAGPPHLEVLRYAREHGLAVLPLESRPAGSRPVILRDSEIRWNLANFLGKHAAQRLVVLYGVNHLFGPDAVTEGIDVPGVRITSYGDSVRATFARREGRLPSPGEVLRLREGVYFQDLANDSVQPHLLDIDLGERETLLSAVEEAYLGEWQGLGLLVEALGDPEVRWRRAAFHALRNAAQHSFGYDPEAEPAVRERAQRRFAAWWEENQRLLVGGP